jgi:hypothetical protein
MSHGNDALALLLLYLYRIVNFGIYLVKWMTFQWLCMDRVSSSSSSSLVPKVVTYLRRNVARDAKRAEDRDTANIIITY